MSDEPRRYIAATKMPDKHQLLEASNNPAEAELLSMLNNTLEILRREIKSLMQESSRGKLAKGSSTDLVNYLKLLKELTAEENDLLKNLSDDEIKEMLENRNAQAKSKGPGKGASEEK